MSRPVTQADRDQVAALHAQGLGRNAIARQLGRSASTVTQIATEAGLSFDRSATAAATEAAKVDNAARRAKLIARAYTRAEAIYDRLEADQYRFTATSVHGIETVTLDHVPAPDEKALASAINSYLTGAVKLEQVDSDSHGLAAVDQWLRGMVGG